MRLLTPVSSETPNNKNDYYEFMSINLLQPRNPR